MALDLNIDSIGNRYLGYIDPYKLSTISDTSIANINTLLNSTYGTIGGVWNYDVGGFYGLRFPVAFETITGSVGTGFNPGSGTSSVRFCYSPYGTGFGFNTTNATSNLWHSVLSNIARTYTDRAWFVANQRSFCFASFDINRTVLNRFCWAGWLTDTNYTGTAFPRSFAVIWMALGTYPTLSAYRVSIENASNNTTLLTSNPASIVCQISTPGADATDIILRDSASPNTFAGVADNLIMLPSSVAVGKIYKNNGVDPSGSDNGKWMCVGDWGSNKLGMRVWTENIT